MPTLPECLLAPKSVVTASEDRFLDREITLVERQFKKEIAAGWLQPGDFPITVPERTPVRLERYTECRFVRDNAAEVEISCGVNCDVVDVHYICEFRSRLVWNLGGHDLVLLEGGAKIDQSFDVMKPVLVCPGGAEVLPGVRPYTGIPAHPTFYGKYDAAADTTAGGDCPPCNCFPASALTLPWEPPSEQYIQAGLEAFEDGGKIKVIREEYWKLRLPRRRVSACVEVDTYILMDRTTRIDVATKKVIGEPHSSPVKPEQTRDFTYTIPGCVPPETAPGAGAGDDAR